MKASELIKALQQAIVEHGDLNVEGEGCEINQVTLTTSYGKPVFDLM